jgi:hypothetical protein
MPAGGDRGRPPNRKARWSATLLDSSSAPYKRWVTANDVPPAVAPSADTNDHSTWQHGTDARAAERKVADHRRQPGQIWHTNGQRVVAALADVITMPDRNEAR